MLCSLLLCCSYSVLEVYEYLNIFIGYFSRISRISSNFFAKQFRFSSFKQLSLIPPEDYILKSGQIALGLVKIFFQRNELDLLSNTIQPGIWSTKMYVQPVKIEWDPIRDHYCLNFRSLGYSVKSQKNLNSTNFHNWVSSNFSIWLSPFCIHSYSSFPGPRPTDWL